jgi:translation elongation factor EF-Ts
MADAEYLAKLIKEVKLNKSLDADVATQTIEEGIKHIISKTQENCKLTKVYQRQWDPEQGEILHSYVHNPHKQTNDLFLGKIGALIVTTNSNSFST